MVLTCEDSLESLGNRHDRELKAVAWDHLAFVRADVSEHIRINKGVKGEVVLFTMHHIRRSRCAGLGSSTLHKGCIVLLPAGLDQVTHHIFQNTHFLAI